MGQSLSEPKTEKHSSRAENEVVVVGSSSMQGWRIEMEDAHSVQLSLSGDRSSTYLGVFDGHGGPRFASYCSDYLHKQLVTSTDFGEGNYQCALKSSFLTLDKNLQEDPGLRFQYEPGGTTAIVVLVKDKQIYCANVGDSRAIASVKGEAQELSYDHKPYHPVEENRIYRAGGWIEFNRVNGNLALSRAIGDFDFKKNSNLTPEEQIVTADPEIVVRDITPDHEFIVLACDGVWDVMSNQEVVDFVRMRIADRMKPHQICEALLDNCLAPDCRMGGVGCDNMTVVMACLLQGGSYTDLVKKCSELRAARVESSRSPEHQKKNSLLANGGAATSRSTTDNSDDFLYSSSPTVRPAKLTADIVTDLDSSGAKVKVTGTGDGGVNDEEAEGLHESDEDQQTCGFVPIETTV